MVRFSRCLMVVGMGIAAGGLGMGMSWGQTSGSSSQPNISNTGGVLIRTGEVATQPRKTEGSEELAAVRAKAKAALVAETQGTTQPK